MAESGIVKGVADEDVDSSDLNRMEFLIKVLQRDMSTAIPVIITAVQAGDTNAAGYVDARPLVAQLDAWGNALPMAALHHLPYFRLQAGRAGIVLDPVPGDIGLAVFAQSDCSTLKQGQKETAQPGSWRKFDQADGFYIGGFLNAKIGERHDRRAHGHIQRRHYLRRLLVSWSYAYRRTRRNVDAALKGRDHETLYF